VKNMAGGRERTPDTAVLCRGNACTRQAHRDLAEITLAFGSEAEVVKPWCIRIMRQCRACRSQDISEMTVEVLNVGIASNLERVLPEAKNRHYAIVECLGLPQIGDRNVDVVYADYLGHG